MTAVQKLIVHGSMRPSAMKNAVVISTVRMSDAATRNV